MGITGKIQSGRFRENGSVRLPTAFKARSKDRYRPRDICPKYDPISMYFPQPDDAPPQQFGPPKGLVKNHLG